MRFTSTLTRRVVGGLLLALLTAQAALAADIRVVTSGAFTGGLQKAGAAVRGRHRPPGHQLVRCAGNAPDSIPSRFARGEAFDMVILSEGGLEALMKDGKLVPGSRVDIVRSQIGAAVRKGTPKPDISTVAALKQTLLNAPSVAYPASASGTYLSTELFAKLGVQERLAQTGKNPERTCGRGGGPLGAMPSWASSRSAN